MALRGSSSTIWIAARRCVFPRLPFAWASIANGSCERRSTTNPTGVSPHRSEGAPTTAASSTSGCDFSAASRSDGSGPIPAAEIEANLLNGRSIRRHQALESRIDKQPPGAAVGQHGADGGRRRGVGQRRRNRAQAQDRQIGGRIAYRVQAQQGHQVAFADRISVQAERDAIDRLAELPPCAARLLVGKRLPLGTLFDVQADESAQLAERCGQCVRQPAATHWRWQFAWRAIMQMPNDNRQRIRNIIPQRGESRRYAGSMVRRMR